MAWSRRAMLFTVSLNDWNAKEASKLLLAVVVVRVVRHRNEYYVNDGKSQEEESCNED